MTVYEMKHVFPEILDSGYASITELENVPASAVRGFPKEVVLEP